MADQNVRQGQQGQGQSGQGQQGQRQGPSTSRTGPNEAVKPGTPGQQGGNPPGRAGEQETPEQWLEENSLGNPDETGNTITGENEY